MYPYLPDFVRSFLRDKKLDLLDEVYPDAGPETEVCAKNSTPIGTDGYPEALYNWMPDVGIEDPFSPKTIYNARIINNGSPRKIPFLLRATDGNCWIHFDSTQVTVFPTPLKQPVDGSWSVCPYVEKVDYWTKNINWWDEDETTVLHWLVSGGEVDSFVSADSIKVNWWDTNFNASVRVFAINGYGCVSDTSVFPVRINVELITETPKGPDQLCIADSKNITYYIRRTNGSVYKWNVGDGTITSGQGTNKIEVDWQHEGIHNVTVEETSHTIDTVCYGESEPLVVEVVNDSLEIELDNVSFNTENKVEITYQNETLDHKKHELSLIQENEYGEFINEIGINGRFDGFYILPVNTVDLTPTTFRLKVINSCNEIFYSRKLETIVLYGREVKNTGFIRLSWNKNRFWENDRLAHEI